MEWYEHLFGILAMFTCMNWIIIMAAVHVGAKADERSGDSCVNPTNVEKCSTAVLTQSLVFRCYANDGIKRGMRSSAR